VPSPHTGDANLEIFRASWAIVLKRFPDPRPDLSLEDILAFRRDPETQYKFAKLWHWMHKVNRCAGSP